MDQARLVLVIVAVIAYVGIGVWALVDPVGALSGVGVTTAGQEGVIELRAMYGGLQLGMGAFLMWCLRTGRAHVALVAGTLTIGCLGLVRALGWVAAGLPWSMHAVLVTVELTGGLAGVVVWWRGLAEAP